MRIVIDMQGAQTASRFRGIGRYTKSLTKAIVRQRGKHEIILALNGLFPDTIEPLRAAFDGLLPQENIRVWYAPGPVRESDPQTGWRREVAERIREAFLASIRPDVILVSSLFEGYVDDAVTSIRGFVPSIPTAVILYDLIPLLQPGTYLEADPLYSRYYRRKVEQLKRANQWLAISESAASEARSTLNVPQDRIANISAACEKIFRKAELSEAQQTRLLEKFRISKPFILYSGGADDRKNLNRLLRAYANLPRTLRNENQLVLLGQISEDKSSGLMRTARLTGISERELIFTGHVTDEELVRFYNLCTVFVFPSMHEGFGLPVLEAMACGAPVICANTTSLPEVFGFSDGMFDPYDESDITEHLTKALVDDLFRTELTKHGREQARKFSWEASAQKTIAALERLHNGESGSDKPDVDTKALLDQLTHATATSLPFDVSAHETLAIAHALTFINAPPLAKQLFVDVSELCQRDARTGVQRVTRSILNELLSCPPKGYVVEPVYATADGIGYRYAREFTARFQGVRTRLVDEPIDYFPKDLFLGLDLQHHITGGQAKYLAKMRRDGVSIFFVVYDLLPIHFPQFWPSQQSAWKFHHDWLYLISQFDGALCISQAVAQELREWQRTHGAERLRPFKIGWFHLGADVENSVPTRGLPEGARAVLRELRLRPTFLTVGTVEPRKEHAQILGAMEQLWREGADANLVIVGKQGWMVESLARRLRRHSEYGKRLYWLEGISDEYLEKVYAGSTCLIAASQGEGFGLPLIEAAQHKLPIIARDIPAFREVAGRHAYYFSGNTPDILATSIRSWLALNAEGKAPRSEGMPSLSWAESAKQLISALLNAAGRGEHHEHTPVPETTTNGAKAL